MNKKSKLLKFSPPNNFALQRPNLKNLINYSFSRWGAQRGLFNILEATDQAKNNGWKPAIPGTAAPLQTQTCEVLSTKSLHILSNRWQTRIHFDFMTHPLQAVEDRNQSDNRYGLHKALAPLTSCASASSSSCRRICSWRRCIWEVEADVKTQNQLSMPQSENANFQSVKVWQNHSAQNTKGNMQQSGPPDRKCLRHEAFPFACIQKHTKLELHCTKSQPEKNIWLTS